MKPVELKFSRVEVVGSDARNDMVDLLILFDVNGQQKGTKKQIKITDPKLNLKEYSIEILGEVRSKVKNLGTNDDSDDFVSSLGSVKCMQDEEVLEEKLSRFLVSVREKVRNGKRSQSYWTVENDLKKLKFAF